MPLYNTATTAAALDISAKWLDNLLSHNRIEGVVAERQGVARRLSLTAVETVGLTHDLVSTLGMPVAKALAMAYKLLHDPGRSCTLSPGITLSIDASTFARAIALQLAQAVEMAPNRRRGRPRTK